MDKRTLRGIAATVVLLAVVVVGGALAQDDGTQTDIEVAREAELSTADQIAEGQRIHTRGANLSRQTSALLDEARRQGDIIRVTCLDAKLTEINANLRTVEQRVQALRDAVSAVDDSRRDHEFTVLSVLSQKFSVLEQEANQCVGQDIYETGATEVTTTVDPGTPDGEATQVEPAPSAPTPAVTPPESPAS